ncbi:MAG: hypothetical protein NT128_02545 [Proteobacteria bacterium]|nr:hypothetical protein [Pseudomonadota bacterium]
MKTQLKLLALAIAAFNLAQASDQGDDLGLGGNEKRLRIPDQNRQLNEEGVNKLEMVKPQSRSYLGSLWGMASNGLSALRNAPHYVASAAYNAWYETPTQKDASVEKKVSVVTESETAMAKKATASKEPREANDAVARKATAAPAKELKEVSVNDNEKSGRCCRKR